MQTIVNLGTGGADLNGQSGSSTGADTNDPMLLAWPGDNSGSYVYLPGAATNYLAVPDEAALDITGDIDIRVRVALDDWTPASNMTLIGKMNSGSATNRSWRLRVNTAGTLTLIWSVDGTNVSNSSATSTVATALTDGSAKWVRVVLDVDDGGVYKVYFYLSDDAVTWTQLGTTVSGAATTSIYAGTETLYIGSGQGSEHTAGKVYQAVVKNGIDGTTVLDVDCGVLSSGSATTLTAVTGQTVTISRSTSGRKSVAVVSRVWLLGTDDYLQVADNALLNFDADDSMTVVVIARVWSTPVAFMRYVSKANASVGYNLLNNNTNNYAYFSVNDGGGAAGSSPTTTAFTTGQIIALSGVRNGATKKIYHYINSTESTQYTDTTTGTLSNTGVLRIGAESPTAGSYLTAELLAVAIFRRALSATEIAALTTYYQNKAA